MKPTDSSADSIPAAIRYPLPVSGRLPALRWCFPLLVLLATLPLRAATITWTGGSGDWDAATNWSTGSLPGASDDVVIGPGPAITVTHSSGADSVNSIQNEQTFVLSGGSLAVSSSIQADGLFTLAGGGTLTLSGGITSTNFVLAGGTLAGDAVITGAMTWNSGTLSAGVSLTVATNGVLNLSGSTTLAVSGSLTNAGTVNWTGTGDLVFGYDTINTWLGVGSAGIGWIVNQAGAVFNAQNDQTMVSRWGSPYFNNAGLFRKSPTTGTTTIGVGFNNTGIVEVDSGTVSLTSGAQLGGDATLAAGAQLNFAGGGFASSGFNVSGAGVAQVTGGTLTVNGTVDNLTLAGGSLTGDSTISGTMTWSSGTLSAGASLTVATNGVLNLSGSTTLAVSGSLTNAGTVNWTGTGDLVFGYDTINTWLGVGSAGIGWIVNQAGGVFNAQNDQTMVSGWGSPYFNNAGLFRKSPTTGTTTIGVGFNNTGIVEVDSGTVSLTSGAQLGGDATLAAGAHLNFAGGGFASSGFNASGAGVAQVTGGTLTVNGTVDNLTLAGGSLTGDSTISGTMTWNSGTLSAGASLTVATNGVLNLSGSTTLAVYGSLTNAGTVNWTGTGDLVFGYDTINTWLGVGSAGFGWMVNQAGAVFNAQNDETMVSGWGSPYFNNAGLFRKSPTTGTTTIGVGFNNTGIVEVDSGTVAMQDEFSGSGGVLSFGLNGTASFGRMSFGSPLEVATAGTLEAHLARIFHS